MKSSNSFQKELNKGWLPAVVNNIYIDGKLEKNVFCHAKLVHKINCDSNNSNYYEIMTPTDNFKISYVTADKIIVLN